MQPVTVNLVKNPKYWTTKNCEQCGKPFEGLIKRTPRFCCASCSSLFTANDPNRLNKIKKTKLKRYGNASYVNPAKAKKTCLEKYGVDNASKSQEVLDKIKSVNQEKYGVDWAFQAGEVKQKIIESNVENYGVEHVSQREDVKEKKKVSFNENFGVDNPFQSDEIKEKVKASMLKRYGVEYPSQNKESVEIGLTKKRLAQYHIMARRKKFIDDYEMLFSESGYVKKSRSVEYPFRCRKCNSVFNDHLSNDHPRCLKCYPLQLIGTSTSEQEIASFISSLNVGEVIENSRKILPSGQKLDIYLPKQKIAFEFDGLYFHSELAGKSKSYHLNKTEECASIGIHLIHVFEDEWKNKQDIIKSKIKNLLVKSKRIGARELVIKKVSTSEKDSFLRDNHIQGEDRCGFSYGAYLKDELVAVCTFSKLRVALGNKSKVGEYELSRFATSQPLVGVLQKFIKRFHQDVSPTKIISYADRRFTSEKASIYNKCGFVLKSITSPNYWYFQNGYYQRYHRFGFRKNNLINKVKNFDARLTEWENMKNSGWNRIWDCGNLKYELNF